MGSRQPRCIVFLHGYTTPHEPSRETLSQAFTAAGLAVELHTPTAPSGDLRVDPFNPDGAPSWFRYATDLSSTIPQQLDAANLSDVHDVMYAPWTVDVDEQVSLWSLLTSVCALHSASNVALVGESQGGVMAALLGIEWNRQNPRDQLGWIGLVRTAPDTHTWQPRPRASVGTWELDPMWSSVPPRYATHFSIILGAEDLTYRVSTSVGALGPLLINNPIRTDGIGLYHAVDGNVDLRILPEVTHDSHEREVWETLANSLAGYDGLSP